MSFAHFEKPPMASKKFLAYFASDLSWTILLAYGIYHRDDALFTTSVLFTMILIKGFVTVGFLLGQSYVDRFVRIAEIAAHAPQTLTPTSVPSNPVDSSTETPKV